MKIIFSLIFFLLFFLASVLDVVFAGDLSSNACRSCHIQTVEHDISKQFLHRPFTEGKCAVCHLGKDDSVQEHSSSTINSTPAVSWIGVYSSPDFTHALKLSRIKSGRSLFVEADLPKLPSYKMQVKVPEHSTMSPVVTDHKPPVLTEIRVDEVKRSVLISAVISWKTDELANSTIRYGSNRLDKSFHDDDHFSKNHEFIISGLRADTDYTYKVISADIFGNETTSQPYIFSTKRFFSAAVEQVVREPAEVFITHNFLRIDDDTIMLELSANTPVSISIGYYPESQLVPDTVSSSLSEVLLPDDHERLSGKEWTGITSCYSCHETVAGPLSHPVNVRPSGDMVIPQEYPTLPDGRISCMSCHVSHGANLEYRLLKASKKELCIGCHRDMA